MNVKAHTREFKGGKRDEAGSREYVYVSPGRHDVLVRSRGKVLYEQRISVRVDETKLIKL